MLGISQHYNNYHATNPPLDFLKLRFQLLIPSFETSEVDFDKFTLGTSEVDVDKTTLETSEVDVDKSTLEKSEVKCWQNYTRKE